MSTRRTPDDWQHIIEQYKASGLKASEFCRQNNITLSNFYVWRRKLMSHPTEPDECENQSHTEDSWQLITPPTAQTQWDIELSLPGGITLRMRR